MQNIVHKIADLIRSREKRITIGISGHGASGKTTFANNLLTILGQDCVNYMNTDAYIVGSQLRKHTLIDFEYKSQHYHGKMTACHPAAHHTLALERDIHMLRDGLDLYTIGSNYSKSKLLSSHNKVNMVEGMSVAFTDPHLYDLKIYLYTDGETELTRRSIRDVSERGSDIQYLRKSHEMRRVQYELFMHPYQQSFDIVIKNSNDASILEKGNFDELLKW